MLFIHRPRSSEEIVDFISDKVFCSNDDSEPQTTNQWVEVISAEPPLIVIHGFLEDSYCDEIIDATTRDQHELQRSTIGADKETSDHRTSQQVWLHEEHCTTPLRTFAERTSALSGLPPKNMENLQVVRYQPGEEFQLHTDHLER